MLNRLRVLHGPLEQYLVGAIERGVSPDIASAHVIPAESAEAMGLEPTLLRRSVSGSQIRRYHNWHCDQYLIYTSRETIINRYPATMAHLESFRHLNTCKEVIQGKHPWWALHRPRNPQIFASPKFIGLTTSKTIEIIYDDRESACVTDAMYVFRMAADQDPWACMTVFHSELFLRLYRIANQGESRVIPQVKASKLQTLPFPSCDIGNPIAAELGLVCRELINLVSQSSAARTAHEAAFLKRQYDAADRTLNELVLHLYQLTENEAASLGK